MHCIISDEVMRNHSSDSKNKMWSSAERTANHILVLLNGSFGLKAVKKNGTEIDEDRGTMDD